MSEKFIQLSLFPGPFLQQARLFPPKSASRFLSAHFLTGLEPSALSSHAMLLIRSMMTHQLKTAHQPSARNRFVTILHAEMAMKKTGSDSVVILRDLLRPTS